MLQALGMSAAEVRTLYEKAALNQEPPEVLDRYWTLLNALDPSGSGICSTQRQPNRHHSQHV
jgi:hypothetical protein